MNFLLNQNINIQTSYLHLCFLHLPFTRTHFHFLPAEQGARSSAFEQSAAKRAALRSIELPSLSKINKYIINLYSCMTEISF